MTRHTEHAFLAATPAPSRRDAQAELATELTGVLADTLVLGIKTMGVRWNMVGPLFPALREMTAEQSRDLADAADALAERLRALGHTAPLSFTDALSNAALDEETELLPAGAMVSALAADHRALARRHAAVAARARLQADLVTEDLVRARTARHEQAAWKLSTAITV